MNEDFERLQKHYVKLVKWIKDVLEDDDLTAEEKIRILGNAL